MVVAFVDVALVDVVVGVIDVVVGVVDVAGEVSEGVV